MTILSLKGKNHRGKDATDGKSGEECFRMIPNHEHVIQDLYNRIVKKDRAYLTKLSTDYAKFAA